MAYPPSRLQPIGLRHGIRHCPGGDDPSPCITPRILGDFFFVDHFAGSNLNDGRTRSTAFETITYALTQCASGNNDVIIVIDCWDHEPDTITVNKMKVHIIGLAQPTGMAPCLPAILDTPVFTMPSTGSQSEIAGFQLGGGINNAGIELNNNYGSWIHDCWFGGGDVGDTPQDGIRNDVGLHNYMQLRVERCSFFGSLGPGKGTLSRYGIFFDASGINGRHAQFVNNRFFNVGYAIRIVYGIDQLIEHNYIKIPLDDAIGRGIYYHMGTGSLIANNKATDDGADAMTNAAYYDNQPANNAWLCNQEGILDVFPDTTL